MAFPEKLELWASDCCVECRRRAGPAMRLAAAATAIRGGFCRTGQALQAWILRAHCCEPPLEAGGGRRDEVEELTAGDERLLHPRPRARAEEASARACCCPGEVGAPALLLGLRECSAAKPAPVPTAVQQSRWPHADRGRAARAALKASAPPPPSLPLASSRPPAWPKDFEFDFEAEQWAFEGLEMLDYRGLLELALRGWPQDTPAIAAAAPAAGGSPQAVSPAAAAAEALLFSPRPTLQAMLGLGWCDRRHSGRRGSGGGAPCSTPLHIACQQGNWEVARWLLTLGAEADVADAAGETPLSFMARCCGEAASRGAEAPDGSDCAEEAQELLRALLESSRAKEAGGLRCGKGGLLLQVRSLGRLCLAGRAHPATEQGLLLQRIAGLPEEVLHGVLLPLMLQPVFDQETCRVLEFNALQAAQPARAAFADASFVGSLREAERRLAAGRLGA